METYKITLKSGASFDMTPVDATKNILALWIWSVNQKRDQIISFKEGHILSSEIASITYN